MFNSEDANNCGGGKNWGTRIRTQRQTALSAPPAGEDAVQDAVDADLRAVIDAWPALSTELRAGVLAIVRAARAGGGS
jgi:hypothetical protein